MLVLLTGLPGLPLSPGTPCIPSGPCVQTMHHSDIRMYGMNS